MQRRDFLTFAIGAAVWPSAGAAQQPPTPTVGYLSSATPAAFDHFVTAFRRGLAEAGYTEGRNVAIEFRWAEGHNDRLPALAAELVAHRVAVIVATGGAQPALVAKTMTRNVPIVFTGGADPVKLGLVASLARPGGNATGIINSATELTAKRLELLRELVPTSGVVGVLINPTIPQADDQVSEIREAARITGQSIRFVNAASEREISAAFTAIAQQRVGALLVGGDPFFTSRRALLVALAAQHGIPASYAFRDFPLAGGLMSYGADLLDVHRRAGIYAARILKGDKPADLPVMQPTKFELVFNLKTAKALGLTVPSTLIARADEVIE